jgi:hypothetical protein
LAHRVLSKLLWLLSFKDQQNNHTRHPDANRDDVLI